MHKITLLCNIKIFLIWRKNKKKVLYLWNFVNYFVFKSRSRISRPTIFSTYILTHRVNPTWKYYPMSFQPHFTFRQNTQSIPHEKFRFLNQQNCAWLSLELKIIWWKYIHTNSPYFYHIDTNTNSHILHLAT